MEQDHKKSLNEKLLDGEGGEEAHHREREENSGGGCFKCCSKLNNKTVLFIVCCLFACFATSEMIGALAANSLSLLGDATASCVDTITYCSNLYAEYIATPKTPVYTIEDGDADQKRKQYAGVAETDIAPAKDERTRLIHEVYVPGFSLVALVVVTIVIMSLAVMEIRSGGDDSTSAEIMFAFASVNIVVDITCITMFYYRKEDILHNKFTSFSGEPVQTTNPPNQKTMFSNANINMFAAFTHIGSDTLRTIAIYLAAIAATVSGYKSSLCDAWAAIAVSITIFIAIIPLSREVYFAYTGER